MAATAEVVATNTAAEQGATVPTPPAAPKPAKIAPKLAAAPAVKGDAEPKPEAKDKPKAKPDRTAPVSVDTRESNLTKFAKMMNADAEKDGIEVDAPPEERRAKPGPKPGSKREPKPEAAEVAPPAPAPKPKALVIDDTETEDAPEADSAEAADDADTGKPEPRATHQLKAKARLRHGDVDKAIKIAFGDLRPEDFDGAKEALAKKLGVGSKQWADFRRYTAAESAKLRQFEQNATQLSQRLQADFQPMIDARKAFASKDYPRAFELAFGEDISDFSRKAIHQKLSADPEKTRMAQRIEALEKRLTGGGQEPTEQRQQPTPEQAQSAALQREGDRTHKALTEQTDDPEIAHFAKKAAFVRRVVELRGEHYDPTSRTTITLREAAEMARDELKQSLDEWRYEEASGAAAPSSESPGLAGNQPVRTSGSRARSPNPSLAAQAGGSTRSMTRDERIRAFASRMG